MRRLLLVLLAVSAAAATTGDAAPRLSGRIVFASERGSTLENSGIYSVRIDGSAHRALVRNPGGGAGGATWSPDGKLLAFWSERSAPGDTSRGLFLMTARGHVLRRLTPRGLVASRDSDPPSWSPDGRSIAFSGERRSQRGIWAVGRDGTHLRFLARDGFAPVWSPTGGAIAFGSARVSVISARGGKVRRLTSGPFDSSPAWSPDGKTIAFVRSDSNGVVQSIDLVSAAGGRHRRLFRGRDVDIGRTPQWSPSRTADRVPGEVERLRRARPRWSAEQAATHRRLAHVVARRHAHRVHRWVGRVRDECGRLPCATREDRAGVRVQ